MDCEVFRRERCVETNPFVTVWKGTRLRLNKPCAEFLGESPRVICLLNS
jgi:hypothetical protein